MMMMLTGNANSPLYIHSCTCVCNFISQPHRASPIYLMWIHTESWHCFALETRSERKVNNCWEWSVAERGRRVQWTSPVLRINLLPLKSRSIQCNHYRESSLYTCARFVCVFIVLNYKKYRAFEPIKPRDGNKCVSPSTPIALKVTNPLFWSLLCSGS